MDDGRWRIGSWGGLCLGIALSLASGKAYGQQIDCDEWCDTSGQGFHLAAPQLWRYRVNTTSGLPDGVNADGAVYSAAVAASVWNEEGLGRTFIFNGDTSRTTLPELLADCVTQDARFSIVTFVNLGESLWGRARGRCKDNNGVPTQFWIEINTNPVRLYTTGAAQTGRRDLASLLVHEFGHVVGHNHPRWLSADPGVDSYCAFATSELASVMMEDARRGTRTKRDLYELDYLCQEDLLVDRYAFAAERMWSTSNGGSFVNFFWNPLNGVNGAVGWDAVSSGIMRYFWQDSGPSEVTRATAAYQGTPNSPIPQITAYDPAQFTAFVWPYASASAMGLFSNRHDPFANPFSWLEQRGVRFLGTVDGYASTGEVLLSECTEASLQVFCSSPVGVATAHRVSSFLYSAIGVQLTAYTRMVRGDESLNGRVRVSAGWRGGALEPAYQLAGYADSSPAVACAPRATGRAWDCIVAYGNMNSHGQVVVRPLTLSFSSGLGRWTLNPPGMVSFSATLPYRSTSPVVAWNSGTTLWVGFRSTSEVGWPFRTYRFDSSSILTFSAGPILSDGSPLAPTVSQSTTGSVFFGFYYPFPNW